MTSLRLLADDLTGALDAGAEFAHAAGPVHVFWSRGLPDALPPSAALDSGTRELGAGAARCAMESIAPLLDGADIAFKKIDSLMRGPTLTEIACLAARWRCCVIAPAFPHQGRVTRGGQQFARAGDGWAPAGPDLVAALRSQGLATRLGEPGKALAPGVTVFDAETDADLDAIVAGVRERVLWCGTAGLARALAGTDAACPAELPRPILGLFGSDQPATFAQLAACAQHWTHLPEHGAHDLADRLARGLALVSIGLPPGLARADAARRIGARLHGIAAGLPRPGTLLTAGGETLRGLCTALGAHGLRLEGRIAPGLPRSVLRGGAWDGVCVVSKSGAFGPPDLLRDLLAANGFALGDTG